MSSDHFVECDHEGNRAREKYPFSAHDVTKIKNFREISDTYIYTPEQKSNYTISF